MDGGRWWTDVPPFVDGWTVDGGGRMFLRSLMGGRWMGER